MGIGAGQALAFAASYIALLVLLGVALSANVVRQRFAARVALGDGNDRTLMKRIRAHGNFSEYAPLLIAILILLPLLGAREWLVHMIGLPALVGRLLHGIGITRSGGPGTWRQIGMILTYFTLIIGAIALLVLAWR